MSKDTPQHKGAQAYRLQDSSNRKEIVFAKEWREFNRLNPNFLSSLLGRNPTDSDRESIATIIQWMGTKNGLKFIESSCEKCKGLIKV